MAAIDDAMAQATFNATLLAQSAAYCGTLMAQVNNVVPTIQVLLDSCVTLSNQNNSLLATIAGLLPPSDPPPGP